MSALSIKRLGCPNLLFSNCHLWSARLPLGLLLF